MEGGGRVVEYTRQLAAMGIPVMAHLGLTPTFVNQFGGYRVQGRSDEAAEQILADARALEEAGALPRGRGGVPRGPGPRGTQGPTGPPIRGGGRPHCAWQGGAPPGGPPL